MLEKFELTIKTNDRYVLTGTDETVQVKITGGDGSSTDWHTLDYFFENDFEPGAKREYTVCHHHHGKPIGPPVILSFRLCGANPLKNWMVDHVVTEHQDKKYNFLVYKWVENDEVAVTTGEAQLPQNVGNEVIRKLRATEIESNRNSLLWNPKPASDSDLGWGINRYLYVDKLKGIPRVYRKNKTQKERDGSPVLETAVDAGLKLFAAPNGVTALDDYKLLYNGTKYGDPVFIDDWKQDVEFGRQVLTGVSPNSVKRCTKLPENCNVTEQHVGRLLETGKTLASEMQAGKIYIDDYSYASNIERNKVPLTNNFFEAANCIGLFYSTPSGDFVPIAIQLVPGDVESIFTPTDKANDWILAKMYFRTTQSCIHEWVAHFFLTHGLSETFSVGTFRSLPHCHPLYKLLRPHLVSVVAVNEGARRSLLPPQSLANQALALSATSSLRLLYKDFDLSSTEVPKDIKSRGVEDPCLLPNYHYRDDALDVWNVINNYVKRVISFFYRCNVDVKNDFELQGWASELANEGLGWQDGNTRGMPEKIETVDELVRICTIIIFMSSAQHAAVNFGQMETYQFVPNAPGSLLLPPHKKGEGNLKRILDTLPGPNIGLLLVTFAYALSKYAEDEVFLGDFVEDLFVEEEVKEIQKDFTADLNKLDVKFNNRNKSLKYPYWYLLPDKIPVDINV